MSTSKSNLLPALFWGFLITLGVFFLVHFIYYGWFQNGLPGYSRATPEIIQTAVLSFAYAYLYTRASINWRAYPNAGFLNTSGLIAFGAKSKTNWFWVRIGNSILFSLLTCVIIIMSLYLAGVVLSTLYVFILEGIRGAAPPPEIRSTGVLFVQVGLSGLGMELVGKTEDQPRN